MKMERSICLVSLQGCQHSSDSLIQEQVSIHDEEQLDKLSRSKRALGACLDAMMSFLDHFLLMGYLSHKLQKYLLLSNNSTCTLQ